MNRKVDTAYFLNDPRKFDSVEQAEKELNRLRAVCIRLKKKQDEDITFLLGLSVTSSQWYGKMGYDKPKSEGGRKRFICSEKRIHNGERVTPCTDEPPHLHSCSRPLTCVLSQLQRTEQQTTRQKEKRL